tara:strand:- start:151 stop:831 length:681 start_codon:yes stop_codon:yes gene_type:complete
MPKINYVLDMIKKYNMKINGVLHIGAHRCEELNCYLYANINSDNIFWIEANENLYNEIKTKYPLIKIGNYCISNEDNKEVTFNISSNDGQSSSILNLGLHSQHYPNIVYTKHVSMKTTTIKTLYKKEHLKDNFANYLHLDIQGAELLALKGAENLLNNYDYIYTEVNKDYMYENCALMSEIDDYLLKYNFKRVFTDFSVGPFFRKNGNPIDEPYPLWGDALYIKKK